MKLKKTLLIILTLTFTFTNFLQAQDGYKKIWDNSMWSIQPPPDFGWIPAPPRHFIQFNKRLNHFPQIGSLEQKVPYIVLDNDGFKKNYTAFNTGISQVDNGSMWGRANSISNFYYHNYLIWKTRQGLFFIKNPGTEPVFEKFIKVSDLPAFPHDDPWYFFTGFHTLFSVSAGKFHNIYTIRNALIIADLELTEYLWAGPFPSGYEIPDDGQYIIPGTSDNLWIRTTDIRSGLLEFNVASKEWTVWDSTKLPFTWKRGNNGNTSFAYETAGGFLDWEKHHPRPIIPIRAYYKEGNNYYTDNAFLYFNWTTMQYDTINVNHLLVGTPWEIYSDKYVISSSIVSYNSNLWNNPKKIFISWSVPYEWQGTAPLLMGNIVLYDWDTREIEIIPRPADTAFTFHNIWDPNSFFVQSAGPYSNDICNKCLGILYNNGDFFVYNPTTSVIEKEYNIEIFPDLWFRELFPNPITTSGTVTANIMCYVSDISTVELGLYDFMGKKVLDLSNKFEYEAATATISTTFEIPKSLAKGSYFLVVRSGKETRTKGIIVQ